MNILLYYDRPILPNDGGIACISLSLIKSLEKKGYVVFALAKKNVGKGIFLPRQYILPCVNSIFDEESILFTRCLLQENGIDIVINQQPIDDLAETFWIKVRNETGIKVFSVFHNPITLSAKNYCIVNENRLVKRFGRIAYNLISSTFVRWLLYRGYIAKNKNRYKRIVKNSDRVVVLCDGMYEELVKMVGYKSNNVTIIPNFLDQIPKYIESSDKENLIVWCGQTNFSVKRLDIMLEVWSKLQYMLQNWRLSILGDGPDLDRAKEMAMKLRLTNIFFEGRVSPSDYYRRAKFVVITSAYESFSLVLLEAMAHSAIPIGFDTFPAAKFMLKDIHRNLFVSAYDKDALCEKLNSMAENEVEFVRLQKRSYLLAQELNSEYVSKKWFKEIQILMT